jgi:hypothetical protein
MEDIMIAITKTSLRTLLGAAALVGLVSTLAAPASAALGDNGVEINGIHLNGVHANGVEINGTQINGTHLNGTQLNGLVDNGVAVKGTSGAAVARPDGAFDFDALTIVGVTPPAAR